MSRANDGQCPDCHADGVTTKRPNPYPGGRCYSHHNAKKRERKQAARARRWKKTYGISAEDYAAIIDFQNGRCALCQRASGASRALAVDHDHRTGMVRGALCSPCNLDVLGHARDDIEFFERCISYLQSPPAIRAIGIRIVPDHPEE